MALTHRHATWLVAVALQILLAPSLLADDRDRGSRGGGASDLHFRLWAASDSGSYSDQTYNQAKDTASAESGTKLQAYEVEVAGTYDGWMTEIIDRSLTVKNTDYWSKRSELAVNEGYQFDEFPWVQPYVGFFQMSESDDASKADAPAAFIDTNRVLTFGARTSFMPVDFGGHGPLVQARIAYLTSLEKSRNFGKDVSCGLGYAWVGDGVRLALAWSREWSYFNATQKDPTASADILHVRDTYVLNKIGLYVEF